MWSMPRSLLKIVAGVIVACALTGLVLGFEGAPRKGRLPGESIKGDSAEALTATDVTPIVEDAPPPPPAPEDKKVEEEKQAEVDPADAQATPAVANAPTPAQAPPKPGPKPAEDKVGDLLDGVTPPPQDDPPH
jgi:hypothetical protein